MIKKILIGIVGVIVVLLIIGFVLPSKFEIARSATINAAPQYVFEEVNDLEKWNNWDYWHSLDPEMKITYSEQKSGTGATYEWSGNSKVGEGKLQVTESNPAASISADLFFMQSPEPSKAKYTFEPEGENTKVTISFATDFGMNPFMRWMGAVFFPSEMEKAFDYNLSKLKEIAEAKPKFSVPISEEETQPISYVGISTTMSYENAEAINAQMGKSYGELGAALGKAKVAMTGPAIALYPKWDETTKQMEMVCAFPVAADAKVPAKYKVTQISGGKAVKAIHKGDYNTMMATHEQIVQYITFKKLEISGVPYEVYITDPMTEKDTAKWVTEIYYPVKQ
ncbi:MAG TPA: SRPBCC family protein [Cyclobacteriaceae bacterium]|nr:SRPBCC family protein [Cyclobacteriaceae bacterium]